jgi:hypothetical protein
MARHLIGQVADGDGMKKPRLLRNAGQSLELINVPRLGF